jgi:membrane fusion protein, heavy metal efflux system
MAGFIETDHLSTREGTLVRNVMRLVAWCLLLLLVACRAEPPDEKKHNEVTQVQGAMVRVNPKAELEIGSQSVQSRQLSTELAVQGRLEYSPDRYVKISSPLNGVVRSVHGKLGNGVSRDESLLTIESPEIITTYAQLTESEADRNLAIRSRDMVRDLYQAKALPKKDLDHAEAEAKRTEADYQRIRERLLVLKVAESELNRPAADRKITGRFELKAPFDGVIVEKNVSVGQLIDLAESLYTVANTDLLQAVGDIYERDLRMVRVGMPVTVTVDFVPNQRFSGVIRYIGDVVDPTSRTVKIRCDVTNRNHQLKADMFARISVEIGSHGHVVAVPLKAVIRLAEKSYVFVQHSREVFERREVQLGSTFGELVEVLEGLESGDQIAVEGSLLLEGALEKQLT